MSFISPGSVPGVAGLGINFCPSPPLPLLPIEKDEKILKRNVNGSNLIHPHQVQRSRESIRHSISYDTGLNSHYHHHSQHPQQQQQQQYHNPSHQQQQQQQQVGNYSSMYRNDSMTSKNSSTRNGSSVSSGMSQIYGTRTESMNGSLYRDHGSATLSPFTSSDDGSLSSPTNSHSYSPPSASLSNTSDPSVLNRNSYQSSNYQPHPLPFPPPPPREIRHTQSMSTLPTVFRGLGFSTNSVPYPLSPTYLPLNPSTTLSPSTSTSNYQVVSTPPITTTSAKVIEAVNVNRSPSRLPAFLIERHRREALARPKSMMELGQMYALDAIVDDIAEEEEEEEAEEEEEEEEVEDEAVDDEYFTSGNGVEVLEMEEEDEDQYADAEVASTINFNASLRQSYRPSKDDDFPLTHRPSLHRLFSSRGRSLSTGDAEPLPSELAKLRLYASMNNLRAQSELIQSKLAAERELEDSVVEELEEEEEEEEIVLVDSPLDYIQSSSEPQVIVAPFHPKASTLSLSTILPQNLTNPTRIRSPAINNGSSIQLEQEKLNTARVELDMMLDSSLIVEGGFVKGNIQVKICKTKGKENEVWIGNPKIRIVGFEELATQENRNVFYHHATSLSSFESSTDHFTTLLPCFDSNSETEADNEGYRKGMVGQHSIPFNVLSPLDKGAKGSCKIKQGEIRYIVIASIKIKSQYGNDRSIAHFYRAINIFPYFNPTTTLAPALQPIFSMASKALFMGGTGKVIISASVHREIWVAGQKCYVGIKIENQSSKKMKTLSLALVRSTTIMQTIINSSESPNTPEIDLQTSKKKMAESTLELVKKGSSTALDRTWLGVEAGAKMDLTHFLEIPSDTLTITKGQHLEISYIIRVSVSGAPSSEVSTDIPLTFINFISLDPPPGHIGLSVPLSLEKVPEVSRVEETVDQPQTSTYHRGHSTASSVDSISLSELNIKNASPSIMDHYSRNGTLATLPSTESIKSLTPTFGLGARKQLNHQMSLDCISSAIASATARNRKVGISQLREEVEESDSESIVSDSDSLSAYYGGGGSNYGHGTYEKNNSTHAQLDDLDEIPDDEDDDSHYYDLPQLKVPLSIDTTIELESNLEAFMKSSTFSPEEEPESATSTSTTSTIRPSSPSTQKLVLNRTVDRSTSVRSRPTSPLKMAMLPPPLPPKVISKQRSFAFATPSSPVKATIPRSRNPSPIRSTSASRAMAVPRSPLTRVVSRSLPPPPITVPAKFTRPITASRTVDLVSNNGRIVKQESSIKRIVKKDSSMNLKRTSAVIVKKPSARTLKASYTLSPSTSSSSPPGLDSSSEKSTPDLDHTFTPPQISPRLSQRPPFNSSPRKIHSPSLYSSRSVGDLRSHHHSLPIPPPQRKSNLLPAVQSKVAALETRQVALMRLARLAVDGPSFEGNLSRNHSVANSEASFKLSDLTRANSVESFKAPMLRRQ